MLPDLIMRTEMAAKVCADLSKSTGGHGLGNERKM